MGNTGKTLVIVESPAKAHTISRFLGDDYIIEASIGHIRDLPQGAKEVPEKYRKESWAYLGVNVDEQFEPVYIISRDKHKQVAKLKDLLKKADQLYLATDEDREGEAISWHLTEVLKPKVPVHRLVFHEITKPAILEALNNLRDIDQSLVRAQEARRVIDRLYGYDVSPLLWRKIAPKLSAGRVQSVAMRLVVDRERLRMAFHSASYWDLMGTFFTEEKESFNARLVSVGGRRIPEGRDFDPNTGKLKDLDCLQLTEQEVTQLRDRLLLEKAWVENVEDKPFTWRPAAPFTTSTFQQEASRKCGFSARRAMQVAQSLYENGYITYMRTDSTTLSSQAIHAAREQVKNQYGEEYLPENPRYYQTKVKNAQEAHEAIRPAGSPFIHPDDLRTRLSYDELRLYDMIWKRTVACQMLNAEGNQRTITVGLGDAQFTAEGKTITFQGYLRAYQEGSDDDSSADMESELNRETLLPLVKEKDPLGCKGLELKSHTTQPPSRYTEPALTKALEKMGIGRPSTYAAILDTIMTRNYVFRRGNVLIPTWMAFAVCQLLEQHLAKLVDYQFTAEMEDELDAVSRGELDWVEYLNNFYFGNKSSANEPGLKAQLENKIDSIDAREVSTITIATPEGESPMVVRVGRYGPFLEQDDRRCSLPDGLAPDELTLDKARELFANSAAGDVPLGVCPKTGKRLYVKTGRYGPYVQLGDQDDPDKVNASLLKGMVPENVDLDTAIKLLSLPRTLGVHPDDNSEVVVFNGRYGPYVKWMDQTRSLPDGMSPLDISLEDALALLAQPVMRRGRTAGATPVSKEPLKTLGVSSVTEKPVVLLAGRYGPYVTDGVTNASLPKTLTQEELTLDMALEMLATRAARAAVSPRRKVAMKKAVEKKVTAKKKTVTKKTVTKKASAKKSAVKKSAEKKSV